jgi:hypothetical protein
VGCARGLAALHGYNQSLCHRDVKSFNFLVDYNLNAKLSDLELGTSTVVENRGSHSSMTSRSADRRKGFSCSERIINVFKHVSGTSAKKKDSVPLERRSGSFSSSPALLRSENSIGPLSITSDRYGIEYIYFARRTVSIL